MIHGNLKVLNSTFGHGLEESTLFSQPQETVRKRCSVEQSYRQQKTSQNLSNLEIKRGVTTAFGKTIFWAKFS